MDYKKLVTIVGKGGVFEILNQRPDGLIVKSLLDGKSQFASSRLHHFTLLENISIYTELDSEPLYDIFQVMLDKQETLPLPDTKGSTDDLKKYFEQILPGYDKERVYVSDIKKIIKWFNNLTSHGLTDILADRKKDYDKSGNGEEE